MYSVEYTKSDFVIRCENKFDQIEAWVDKMGENMQVLDEKVNQTKEVIDSYLQGRSEFNKLVPPTPQELVDRMQRLEQKMDSLLPVLDWFQYKISAFQSMQKAVIAAPPH
jgi:hypothetical protein